MVNIYSTNDRLSIYAEFTRKKQNIRHTPPISMRILACPIDMFPSDWTRSANVKHIWDI